MTEKILLLKVLDKNMQSCHGGELQWEIGKTQTVRGQIVICENGLHLTVNPALWMRHVRGSRVFIAETTKIYERDGAEKVVCRTVKLLKELTRKEYAYYEAKIDALYADYRAKRAPLYADYEAKRDALDADYEAKRAPLDADYERKISAILRAML